MSYFSITFKRLIDHGDEEIEGLEPNTILRAKGLRQVLYKLYDLAQNGKLNQAVADLPEYYIALDRVRIMYLLGVLYRFQHCTGHIMTGRWKGRGNQYIQLVKVLYCKLPTYN